jgi:hypothetical protein
LAQRKQKKNITKTLAAMQKTHPYKDCIILFMKTENGKNRNITMENYIKA